jgi:hypothetical protein
MVTNAQRSTAGPRSEVHTFVPWQEGFGTSRLWRREINGKAYSFNLVTMPSGEIRYFVSVFNGYSGGPRFACAWTTVRQWTIPAPDAQS